MTDQAQSHPRTSGVHHIGLSVSDLQGAADFFVDVLGFRIVGERPAYPALFVGDGHSLITLWQVAKPGHPGSFDRKHNEGLHHLALAVDSLDTLDELHLAMVARGTAIEFAPEARSDGAARHMMLQIPGGPRLELIAMAPPQHQP
jgi:catechol 2,3-dioxygenase-like lactoylglutathione lyase family enzyme